MHVIRLRQRFTAVMGVFIVISLLVMPAMAHHSWGKYHVARPTADTTATSIKLNVGDNVDSAWDLYLDHAITDWNRGDPPDLSDRIVLAEVDGAAVGGAAKCGPNNGRIEVCNA